jgi:hypothetical protein
VADHAVGGEEVLAVGDIVGGRLLGVDVLLAADGEVVLGPVDGFGLGGRGGGGTAAGEQEGGDEVFALQEKAIPSYRAGAATGWEGCWWWVRR